MKARVVTAQIIPGKLDDLVHIVEESIIPAAQQQQGYQGYLLLTHPHTNKVISITFWDSEETLMAGELSEYLRQQLAKAGPTFAGAPMIERFDVSVKE